MEKKKVSTNQNQQKEKTDLISYGSYAILPVVKQFLKAAKKSLTSFLQYLAVITLHVSLFKYNDTTCPKLQCQRCQTKVFFCVDL